MKYADEPTRQQFFADAASSDTGEQLRASARVPKTKERVCTDAAHPEGMTDWWTCHHVIHQPSLRDWNVFAATVPKLKHWATLKSPSGRGIVVRLRSVHSQRQLQNGASEL